MTNKEYADSLRMIAKFYERHPELPLPHDANEHSMFGVHTKADLVPFLRAFGSCQKVFDSIYAPDGTFLVTKQFGSITFRVFLNREAICERVVVDKVKTVEKRPKTPLVTAPVEYEDVEVEREIVEWRCPETGLLESA